MILNQPVGKEEFDVEDFKTLLDAVGQAALVSMTDKKGSIIFVNDKFVEVSKYSREELLGQNHRVLKSGKQPQELFQTLWATITSGKIWRGEIMNRAKDDSFYWVDSTIAPILGSDGKPMRYVAVRFLISDKKEVERTNKAVLNVLEDLKEEREKGSKLTKRLALATKSAKIGVWEWDIAPNTLTWDEQMYRLYGIKAEDFNGAYEAWQAGLHPEDKKSGDKAIQTALKGEKEFNPTFRVVWPGGEIRYIQAHAIVDRDAKGEPIKMIGVNYDVTHEKEVDRAKTEFVSLASHQLRTPLSAINWFAEMLEAGDAGELNDEQKVFIKQVLDSNKRMVDLVDSLLNVSRIDLGTFAIEPEDVDFKEVADSVIAELEPKIAEKQHTIERNYDEAVSVIQADTKLIRIIFQNLISNAVKYTGEHGTVSVSIKKEGEFVQISVADTGYGIPKAQQSRVFEKLFRADNVREMETDGTGLGLYIIKAIAEEVKGKAWFESEEGKGATFHVTIPLSGMKKKDGNKELD